MTMKKMKIKKTIWLWIIALIGFLSKVEAVKLRTLKWSAWSEFSHEPTMIEGKRSIFDLIRFVNSYIWFGIWFVCFLFMVINGYKLITAHGDEKKTKEATSALWKSIIWIAICLLAYIIVNIAVKLFASKEILDA